LRDITPSLFGIALRVALALHTQSNRDDNTANLTVTVEISDLEQLAKLLLPRRKPTQRH